MRVDLIQIGDYFAYPTQTTHDGKLKIGRVNFIRHDGIVQVDFVDTNAQLLEPIELTPSILEKNGFKYNPFSSGFFECKTEDGNISCTKLDYWLFYINDYIVPNHFNYVHELQLALKLCNIYKEIVL